MRYLGPVWSTCLEVREASIQRACKGRSLAGPAARACPAPPLRAPPARAPVELAQGAEAQPGEEEAHARRACETDGARNESQGSKPGEREAHARGACGGGGQQLARWSGALDKEAARRRAAGRAAPAHACARPAGRPRRAPAASQASSSCAAMTKRLKSDQLPYVASAARIFSITSAGMREGPHL